MNLFPSFWEKKSDISLSFICSVLLNDASVKNRESPGEATIELKIYFVGKIVERAEIDTCFALG